jgi:starch phosphorylase
MSSYIGHDKRSIQRSIVNHVEYTLGCTRFNFDNFNAYQASAYSVRDRLIEAWNDTNEYFTVSTLAMNEF